MAYIVSVQYLGAMKQGQCCLIRTCENQLIAYRHYADCGRKKALVIGAYEGCSDGEFSLTPTAQKLDEETCGTISDLLKGAGLKKGKALIFGNLSSEFNEVAVAGLGDAGLGYVEAESMDVCKENVRMAAGAGAKALQDRGNNHIMVEGFTSPEAAAEGALLGVWKYQEFRAKAKGSGTKIELFDCAQTQQWKRGELKAINQNIARMLEETPANLMTPTLFAQWAVELLCPCGIHVDVHLRDWIESHKMMPFLTVARGSCESPVFLELIWCGATDDVPPVILTGKGVTYDSGGLNLKRCRGDNMVEFKADMAGAAVVMAAIRCAAQMNLPMNIRAHIPLCENIVGGMAMKPGDVVLSLNGKTIRIENTDNEGRVILADALAFAAGIKPKPCAMINVADFTTGIKRAMGDTCSGVFSTTDELWEQVQQAASETGERVWRFPFWKHYHAKVTEYVGVDVSNVGKGKGGDPCLAAAFLLEFVPPCDFVHFDISGIGLQAEGISQPYLRKGQMSGRPTRLLVQLLYQLACPHRTCSECPCAQSNSCKK